MVVPSSFDGAVRDLLQEDGGIRRCSPDVLSISYRRGRSHPHHPLVATPLSTHSLWILDLDSVLGSSDLGTDVTLAYNVCRPKPPFKDLPADLEIMVGDFVSLSCLTLPRLIPL